MPSAGISHLDHRLCGLSMLASRARAHSRVQERRSGRRTPMKLPRRNSCIWPRALPRCRSCRALHVRKPIRRGRCAYRWLYRRQARRHRRAPDGSMALGTAGPTIPYRKPAWCRRQYWHRGGGAGARRWLHAPTGCRRTRSMRRSTISSTSISFAISRRSRASSRARHCHGGESIISGQDGP